MAKGMVTLWAALAALVLGAAPVRAQDLPLPYPFGEGDRVERPRPDKPPSQIAEEDAAAARAEAACNAGTPAGCAALGRAYLRGAGRPQNRPVADLLLREACTAGAAEACLELGDLFMGISEDETRRFAARSFARGCALGSLDACEEQAAMLEAGITFADQPDLAAAAALRRTACGAGGVAACVSIAAQQFAEPSSPVEEASAKASLERWCGSGNGAACSVLLDRFNPPDPERRGPPSAYVRTLLDQGCRASLYDACLQLGQAVYDETAGPPDQRTAALALFDRACALWSDACGAARDVRSFPALAEGCARGDTATCAALGDLRSTITSPLYDAAEGVRLLGDACDAGFAKACDGAVQSLLYGIEGPLEGKNERVMRWSQAGCDRGDLDQCETFGVRLITGEGMAADPPRGLALLAGACEQGSTRACDALAQRSETDPDAPLAQADARNLPPMTPEEEAALRSKLIAERRAETERDRAQDCTTTTVTLRGVTYTDTVCDRNPRSIGGFRLKVGEAPWQALMWRPAKLGTNEVGDAYRAYCGGAVIATGWVLTAAHCLVDVIDKVGSFPIEKTGYTVRLGVTKPLQSEGTTHRILRVIPHPLFIRGTLAFDIGLVQYDPKPVARGTGGYTPARIALDKLPASQRPVVEKAPVFAFGWGRTALERKTAADHLQGVRLELSSEQACTKTTGFTDPRRKGSVLCAVGAKGEQACFGDSGGPLVTYRDASGVPTLIGVVSGGKDCGTTGILSRYTRLGHPEVRKWLASHVPGFNIGQSAR